MSTVKSFLIACGVGLGVAACVDRAPTYEWDTQGHYFDGTTRSIVGECFADSPGDSTPGIAAAMDFAEVWIDACDQERIDGGWPTSDECTMSYWPAGRECD